MIRRPSFLVRTPYRRSTINQHIESKVCALAPPSYAFRQKKPDDNMVIVILILFFCGAMLLLDRMLCGFIEKVSNSKKMKK